MGSDELIASLRADARERIRQKRIEAERQAEEFSQMLTRKREERRREYDARLTAEVRRDRAGIISRARLEARKILLGAERKLLDRLRALALKSLRELREGGGEELLAALSAELPALHWETVRINAADEAAARNLFPESQIIVDDSISGGVDVATGENRIRVNNTLEIRLKRHWEGMLRPLLDEIHQQGSEFHDAAR